MPFSDLAFPYFCRWSSDALLFVLFTTSWLTCLCPTPTLQLSHCWLYLPLLLPLRLAFWALLPAFSRLCPCVSAFFDISIIDILKFCLIALMGHSKVTGKVSFVLMKIFTAAGYKFQRGDTTSKFSLFWIFCTGEANCRPPGQISPGQ